ncbi:MAG: hypothetical protein E7599_08105 [Ruminococcaceae bacterium]|nr:hypothetical protein [Oscillospiraceae bacterium]
MVNTDSTNGAIIRKMIANQLGMTFFGLIVTMAAASSGNDLIVFGASVFAALFYMYLLFYLASEQGKSDKIRIDGGRATVDNWRLTKLSLLANSVNIGLAVIAIITKMIVSIVSNVSFLQAPAENAKIAPEFVASIFAVCEVIYKFIHSMYNGILVFTGQNGNPLMLLLFVVPSVIACTIGYRYGLKKG